MCYGFCYSEGNVDFQVGSTDLYGTAFKRTSLRVRLCPCLWLHFVPAKSMSLGNYLSLFGFLFICGQECFHSHMACKCRDEDNPTELYLSLHSTLKKQTRPTNQTKNPTNPGTFNNNEYLNGLPGKEVTYFLEILEL